MSAALVLSLCSAATFGGADFLGGLASRRASVFAITLISQTVGLVVVLILMPFLPGQVSTAAIVWGLVAGIGGSLGLLAYFHALSIGAMGVTAPIASLVGATIPVVVGFALGERPAITGTAGIVLGVAATVLVSRPSKQGAAAAATGTLSLEEEPDDLPAVEPGTGTDARTAIAVAALAGLMFGVFFVSLDQAPDDSGLWPLVGSRLTGITIVGSIVLYRRPRLPDVNALGLATSSGLLDMIANTLFLLATREGLLILTSVVTGLYPVGVVVLAWLVLRERLGPTQLLGAGLALGATALIAL